MALSNWATCAWNEKGKMCDGSFRVGKISVDIYKNWAYLRDEKAWEKENDYNKPTIATIADANIDYKRMGIYAKTTKRNVFYIVVNYHIHQKPDRTMYGIGSYAFDSKDCHSGITKKMLDGFKKWLTELNKENPIKVVMPKNPQWFNQGDSFFEGGKFKGVSYPIGKIGGKTTFEKLIKRM